MLHHLVIDDEQIAARQGLTRIFHPTRRHPASPVLSPEKPWEIRTGREGVAAPAVVHDPAAGLYKMWYWASVGGLLDCFATSVDGLHWERPVLGIREFEGSKENNLVETPGRLGPGSILFCPDRELVEGPDKVYRMLSWLPSPKISQRYVPLYSADGLRWTTLPNIDDEPGISGPGVGDTGTCCLASDSFPLDHENLPGMYLAFPRLGCKVGKWNRRAIGFTHCNASPHGNRLMADWPHPVLALAPDYLDDEMARERLDRAYRQQVIHYSEPADHHCEFYGMQVWRTGDLFLASIWVFDISMDMKRLGAWNQHGIMEAQLAYSRDLVHWHRLGDRRPWIEPGEPGTVDDTMIHFNGAPVRAGDELYVYYTASNIPHPSTNAEIVSRQAREILAGRRHAFQHIGLATCRPDGYVSLDAGSSGGGLRTRPFRWQGDHLELNVDASEGEVDATLLGDDGRAVPGAEASAPITGDHLAAAVSFERLDTGTLQGRTVSLLLRMRNARLYSYRLSS